MDFVYFIVSSSASTTASHDCPIAHLKIDVYWNYSPESTSWYRLCLNMVRMRVLSSAERATVMGDAQALIICGGM
ncbi:uncharacterized protein EI90DRAFT_3070776 [Cantharellus anzutake]|uniref:uncharacterized protein n=1 Tax=Cantharellus anzutake TaxID=1750568 RepID=UPI0019054396|nr:uncharacterized protein EI90DRAFT_3070776 [Cantharellus anzutake]KAF8326389.1 hypothetical protein EI90DRAFT_3070776 [Cantharellus anzutake]